MKANNSLTCWLLWLVLCLGLNGCTPRTAQLPNHFSDSAALANLGPKVEDSDAPTSLQIPGKAPGDYFSAQAKTPSLPTPKTKSTTQISGFHAKIGDPAIGQLAKLPTIGNPTPLTESNTFPYPGRYDTSAKSGISVVANRPSPQPLLEWKNSSKEKGAKPGLPGPQPLPKLEKEKNSGFSGNLAPEDEHSKTKQLPDLPEIPEVTKIIKEASPTAPRPELPLDVPQLAQIKPLGPSLQVELPLPEIPPELPKKVKPKTIQKLLPEVPPELPRTPELPNVPPQVEEAPLAPQNHKHQVLDISQLPPPLPVPTEQNVSLPKLPNQPSIPPVEKTAKEKPLPELPPVPPMPELPQEPPVPNLEKKLPDLPPPAPVPSEVKSETLPTAPTEGKKDSPALPVVVLYRPATQAQTPAEAVKPAPAKTGVPEPPAALPAEVKYQTEEPPPLLSAKPLPINGLQPVSTIVPGKPAGSLESLHKLAVESYATIDSYIVRFRRKEQVGGKDMPEELMLFKFHKQPFSVYFKWLAGGAKGREVAYVNGRYGNKLHTLTAAGDIPFIPAGKRMSFSTDSPLVRAKSRHSINEAGVGKMIERFGNHIEDMKRKDFRFGSLKYLGLVKRPEFENPVEAVLHIIPPKVEAELPQGGRRFWYFDTKLRFPVLMITFDEKQNPVEYYCFDRWLFPGRLSDDEFNPNVLWREN